MKILAEGISGRTIRKVSEGKTTCKEAKCGQRLAHVYIYIYLCMLIFIYMFAPVL